MSKKIAVAHLFCYFPCIYCLFNLLLVIIMPLGRPEGSKNSAGHAAGGTRTGSGRKKQPTLADPFKAAGSSALDTTICELNNQEFAKMLLIQPFGHGTVSCRAPG
jgi:hypothetical protein